MVSDLLNHRTRRNVALSLLIALFGFGLSLPLHAQTTASGHAQASLPPVEISPEGVQKLATANIPFVLLDADAQYPPAGAGIRHIYFTLGPWSRSAQNRVLQERRGVANSSEAAKFSSQRLVGTPLDWQGAGLKFGRNPLPSRPLTISPKQLAESIKDGVDLQIVDLRPQAEGSEASVAPTARRLMPHQLDGDTGLLAKQRWVILVDGGNRVAQPFAERLFAKGFVLIAVLDGGYPAWVEATDR